MRTGIKSEHWNDANGNPAGGTTFGNGFAIGWQNGPLGRHVDASDGKEGCIAEGNRSFRICVSGCTRKEQNGAFVEDVIAAAVDRIRYYQQSKFACARNAEALAHLEIALERLNSRTAEREKRKTEGTHHI